MPTRRLTITGVNRAHPIHQVKPADFSTESAGEVNPLGILRDPGFSVYCIDRENDSVIFTEVDDPSAVDTAPFYYQAQAAHAIGLATMPLETFHGLAEQIPQPPKGMIFVHSVGRCGSTLLSKALQAVPTIHSLSEPDEFTQLVNMRVADGAPDEWISQMLVSCARWRCKPRVGEPAERVAIKTRSEVLVLADLIADLFPNEKHLFLYRDGVTWMSSLFKGWPDDRDVYDAEKNQQMERSWSRTIPMVKDYLRDGETMNPIQIRILAWITCMEGCLLLRERGLSVCAARFEELNANPIPVLEALFDHCEIGNVDWDPVRDVLSRDSQAGTIYDRAERDKKAKELTPELAQDVRDMIATRPRLRTPDVVLPGTVHLS